MAHLLKVNNAVEGETYRCGLLNGKTGTATIVSVTKHKIEMEVSRLEKEPPNPLELTLVLALPRPKMLRRIVESVTSLGVKQIFLVNSMRVERSFWQSPVLDDDQLYKSMVLGLEQSGDTILPFISKQRFFGPFVNDHLPTLAKNTRKIVAHPRASKACPWDIQEPVTLVVGPEGGFIDREIQTFKKHGFDICHIGSRILRVETAVTALVSRLSAIST